MLRAAGGKRTAMTENLKNGKPAPPGIGGGDINQRDDIGATLLHEKAADEGAQTAAALCAKFH